METLNPIQNDLVKVISDHRKRLESIEKARQQTWIDWFAFNPSLVTMSGTKNIFTLTGTTDAVSLQTGDRIRAIQGGVTKYFFVKDLTTTTGQQVVTVEAGTDYSLTASTAITSLFFSRSIRPQGFPDVFNFASVPASDGDPAQVTSPGIFTGKFYMIGSIVFVSASRIGLTLNTAVATYINETVPFDGTPSVLLTYSIGDSDGGVSGRTINSYSASGTGIDNVRIDQINYSKWPISTLINIYWGFTFFYIPVVTV